MSIQEGTAPVELERISATASYHESLWGYRFLSNDLAHESQDLEEAALRIEYDVLKEEVRKMLTRDDDHDNKETVEDKLQLIDTIQRLGVAYLFEAEIEGLNENIYSLGEDFIVKNNANIYHTALWFRLLRQQGFAISPNVFTKFKDNAGNFNEELASDVQGLLSLYEAAHLAGHGEDILDEALTFATNNLSGRSNNIEPSLQKQVKFALSLPVWKCVPRTLTRNYIDFYSDDNNTIDKQLLRFAKLDFNRLQKLHRQELREITEWWASLEVEAKFHYARNRIVECYYWIYSMYFEPEYHLARILATKMIAILTLLDDTFDGFGTVDQLDIFTQAIQTFDRSSLQSLPDAMKNIYRTLIDTYDEVEMELAKSGPTFGVDYAKEELKKLCRFYLIEIKTRTEGYVPTVEEHKKVSYVTGAVPFIFVGAFLGMGPELATREAYEWHANRPKIVEAVSIIGRLYNDVVSFQFERDRKHPASSVDCYMKEYNVSEEKAIELIWVEISKKWKDVAESCQKPIDVPVAIIDRILNFARSFNVIYKDGDGFTHPHLMKSEIASVFVDPIPLV